MVDAPIPMTRQKGQEVRAKEELRNKLNTNDFDTGFQKAKPQDGIGDLIRKTPTLLPATIAEQNPTTADIVRRVKKAGSLSIVSSDHTIEDSPNAGHINENIGRSTALSAVKTLAKRKSITDGKSRPLGRRMRRRYIYEEPNLENEIANNSSKQDNSPKEKNTKPEKRGNLVTVNPKLNDDK